MSDLSTILNALHVIQEACRSTGRVIEIREDDIDLLEEDGGTYVLMNAEPMEVAKELSK